MMSETLLVWALVINITQKFAKENHEWPSVVLCALILASFNSQNLISAYFKYLAIN